MENFRKGPNVSEAARVGEPTLVDPKQASAPDLVRAANSSLMSGFSNLNGANKVSVEQVGNGTPAPGNAPIPRSDAPPGATGVAAATSGNTSTAIPELQNDLQPAATSDVATAPEKAPAQVNDAAPSSSSSASSSQSAAVDSTGGTQAQAAPAANPNTESSSKKKKKKVLGIF